MKSKTTLLSFLAITGSSLLAVSSASATIYYWDNTTPIEGTGFGTAGGTWGTDAFWSESSAGTATTGIAAPSTTDDLNFGAVGTTLAAGTVAITGTQSAKSITFATGSGVIVLSGGTIDLAAAATINVNNTAGDTIDSILTGAGTSLTITPVGSGKLTLSENNSYAGETIVNSAGGSAAPVLTVANNTALGTTAGGTTVFGSGTFPYGAQLNLADGITVTGETLTLDPSGSNRSTLITSAAATWAGNVVLNGTSGTLAFVVDSATANLTVGSSAANTVTGSRTFLLRGEFAGTGTVNSTIQDGTGANSVVKAGLLSTWVLTATNTYTGPTNINAGPLSINSILDVNGGASAVGAPITTENGTIGIGAFNNAGTLIYTGDGNTTNRVINLAGTTGGAILDQSGNGLLKFTSNFTATGAGTKTLTLQGSTAGTGEIAGAIVNSSSNATNVTKSGTGTWTLSGINTYMGSTLVTAGTVTVTGSLASAKVTIDSGAEFNGTGTLTFNVDGITADQVVDNGTIDISGLTVAVNPTGSGLTATEYVLVDATGGGVITGTFAGITGTSGYALDYGTPNQVKLVSSGSPYSTWAGASLFTADDNGDGVDNGLAWILGASGPTVSALDKLPKVGTSGGFLTLDFTRQNPSSPAKLYVEYGSDLSGWTKLEIPAGSGTIPSSDIEVVVASPGSPTPDTVTVKIPTGHALGGKLFARLSATEN